MKVLFVQPPIQDFYNTKFREYPLGLLYLASSLKNKENFDLALLDARSVKKPKKIPHPNDLQYLNKFYTKENNSFLNYKHFGMTDEQFSEEIRKLMPDVVCVNAMFTTYNHVLMDTVELIKNIVQDCRVVVGGYHATVCPEDLILSGSIDLVVRGEGEEVLEQILLSDNKERILDNNGKSFIVEDLDKLNFPARELIDPSKYVFNKKPYTMLLTSRGCPNNCVFCSVHSTAGCSYRKRDIDNVLEEIDECIKRYGIQVFDFQDDNLLLEVDRIKQILEKIILKYGKRKLELLASNGLNCANIDVELLMLMKEAGFDKLDLSLATGEVPSRKGLGRPETIAHYEFVIQKAKELGLKTTTYIIIGIPEQPLAELIKTVEYLEDKKVLVSPSVFYNVPGMPIYEKMKKYEYMDSDLARRSTAFNCKGLDFERDDLFAVFQRIRKNNLTC
ncbi:MAG: radical SAM protein [bacterium]